MCFFVFLLMLQSSTSIGNPLKYYNRWIWVFLRSVLSRNIAPKSSRENVYSVVYLRYPLIITGCVAREACIASAAAGATPVFLLYLSSLLHTFSLFTLKINWWKGKPPGSIACTRKQQARFFWSCSSVVMNDATPLTPPSAWAELHFQM